MFDHVTDFSIVPAAERPQYHPGYYAAYVLDPDGTNVESVRHEHGQAQTR